MRLCYFLSSAAQVLWYLEIFSQTGPSPPLNVGRIPDSGSIFRPSMTFHSEDFFNRQRVNQHLCTMRKRYKIARQIRLCVEPRSSYDPDESQCVRSLILSGRQNDLFTTSPAVDARTGESDPRVVDIAIFQSYRRFSDFFTRSYA
jgi:hypothetical protein